MFCSINFVLLVLVEVEAPLDTAASGSGLICFPVQLTLQSSHCEPKPLRLSSLLNVQLSWWPSKFVVTSGRVVWSNHVSDGGLNSKLPIKFTILNGLIDDVLLVSGCSIKVVLVNGNVIKSPVWTVLLLFVSEKSNPKLS